MMILLVELYRYITSPRLPQLNIVINRDGLMAGDEKI